METSQEKGDSYEEFISQLLEGVKTHGRDIRNIKWGKINKILGESGCLHQIDISFIDYSFEEPTLVLIECKNTPSKSVEQVQVAAFKAIIDDILNNSSSPKKIMGVFAYAEKARSGAIKFAEHYDIKMEKTGMKPNFTFKYQNLTQVGILIKGSASMSAEAEVIKS